MRIRTLYRSEYHPTIQVTKVANKHNGVPQPPMFNFNGSPHGVVATPFVTREAAEKAMFEGFDVAKDPICEATARDWIGMGIAEEISAGARYLTGLSTMPVILTVGDTPYVIEQAINLADGVATAYLIGVRTEPFSSKEVIILSAEPFKSAAAMHEAWYNGFRLARLETKGQAVVDELRAAKLAA